MKFTVSLHTKHDANMTISTDNRIIQYIEFEKVVGKRYFCFSNNEKFEQEFEKYIFPFLKEFKDEIIKFNLCWLSDNQKEVILKSFPNCVIEEKKHHISHAYSLYAFTSPKSSDLIVSFDGGGDEEDCFKLYHWENESLKLLKEVKLNLGTPYRVLGFFSNEIKSTPSFDYETNLHLPGKIMGLAPLGIFELKYYEVIKQFYIMFRKDKTSIYEKLKLLLETFNLRYDSNLKIENRAARNILQTSQKVFEDLFFNNTNEIFDDKYKRVLLVGGCSLNIKLNTEVYRRSNKEVFVCPVSGDCGISLGAAISNINLKKYEPFKNAFIGLKYSNDITPFIEKYKPNQVDSRKLAEELAKGKIIATIVGRLEAGARSLGNRSLLASPLQKGIKDKINKIKEREFFRPVAPIVTDKMQNVYFEKVSESRYMSLSPKINIEFKAQLSEIVHYDETCRIQTVTKEDTFIYDLITDFGKITGIEVLINTSLNVKGKPIVNNLHDAFDLFESTSINCLYIDGLLFEK